MFIFHELQFELVNAKVQLGLARKYKDINGFPYIVR